MCALNSLHKFAVSSFHPNGNINKERVNRTISSMLSMVINEEKRDWDMQLPYVNFTNNNTASAVTGLMSNEVHIGRLLQIPVTVFGRYSGFGHWSLGRDQLSYCDLARDHQQRAHGIGTNCAPSP